MHEFYTITDIRTVNYRTKTFLFDRELPAQPGQFVMAWLPEVDEKPFSIAGRDPLALTVVNVGPFSAALHALDVGDRVWVRGPLGQGFEICGERLLLVGGGYGVAPLLFLARKAQAQGCAVEVCIGAGEARDVLLAGAFAALGIATHITTEDGSLGETGLVTESLETAIAARRPDTVYACGPVPMLEAVAACCRVHALPHQLSWEAHIRCGMGLCGACECHQPGWLACKDGPVSFG